MTLTFINLEGLENFNEIFNLENKPENACY